MKFSPIRKRVIKKSSLWVSENIQYITIIFQNVWSSENTHVQIHVVSTIYQVTM